IFAVHSADWRQKAAAQFRVETEGPVIFHSSKDPFLGWIDLRRMAMDRSIVIMHVAMGRPVANASSGLISFYRASPEDSFMVISEDIEKKTNYDTLGAGEARVDFVNGVAPRRTLIPSTKDLNIIWSRDLHSYAYTKQGAVYFASIDDKEARLIAGKKKE